MATCEPIGPRARFLAVLNNVTLSTSELIGSSPKLAAVLEDVKAVAATDCAVLIQGAIGPQPHPSFIDIFAEAAFDNRHGAVERAGEDPAEVIGRPGCPMTPAWKAFVNTGRLVRNPSGI